jgi:NAD(P)H-dependent flavin oxidoreductase YrpB (nitropropane dioxygenase family)
MLLPQSGCPDEWETCELNHPRSASHAYSENFMLPLPPLQIGSHLAPYPIIQGAMAVRVSGAPLASAVANAGGIGLISSFGIGLHPDYFGAAYPKRRLFEANQLALIDAIQEARQTSPTGMIGVNILVATRDYPELAQTAAARGANLIVTAAGMPWDLPRYTEQYPEVALVPIVSNLESAQALCETWQERYQRWPDGLIVENCKLIGGHFASQCESGDVATIATTVAELRHYLNWQGRATPIIVTGGIWDRSDIERMLAIGADGVQMGSRFITTAECSADPRYQALHVGAETPDIITVPSPAGKPARVIRNRFAELALADSPDLEKRCIANCLAACLCRDRGKTYCLLQALSRAAQGDTDQGLLFSGGAVRAVERILPVAELMATLTCSTLTVP